MTEIHTPIPLSLYIHFPWCVRKCPYCDFNSHETGAVSQREYVAAMLRDLDRTLPDVWGRSLSSIFIGGGTPSLFDPQVLDDLLQQLRARFAFPPQREITLEANPGTVDEKRFSEFHSAGINRLSLGIQSFDDQKLESIGRIHSGSDAHRAIDVARQAGFDNINVDLMFGLPHQGIDDALNDLDMAIAAQTSHLSWYQLTIEPHTAFSHHPPTTPDDDQLWEMSRVGRERLASSHLQQYEISAFAAANRQCQHNLNYWQFGDYVGIGAGAHEKITLPAPHTIRRRSKQRSPERYLQCVMAGQPDQTEEFPDHRLLPLEFMMNALRLAQPLDLALFEERTHLSRECLRAPLARAEAMELLTFEQGQVTTTDKGKDHLNLLLELFVNIDEA